MKPPLYLLVVSGALFVESAFASATDENRDADGDGRRMKEAATAWAQEYAATVKPDRRIEDIPPEELAAVEPAPPERPPAPPDAQPAPERARAGPRYVIDNGAVLMDPVIVEGRREKRIEYVLRQHDDEVAKTQKRTEPTKLDSVLNHRWISWLGPYSAENRARMAKFELRVMNMERQLLIAISMAETEAERRELQAMLDQLRAMRRW